MTQQTRVRIADLPAAKRAQLLEALKARPTAGAAGPNHYDVVIMGGGVAGLTLALQLRQERPAARLLVVERLEHPVPETTHKVGESTVEIAAHYLRDVLGLGEHLESRQIRKFGLRMFFSNHDNTDITQRVELGSSVFPPHATYQLDRGRLENELGRRCAEAGVELVTGSRVQEVDLEAERTHHLRVTTGDEERDVTASWVVDATGRNHLLQRKLGLQKEVGHAANAAWFRVGSPDRRQ